MGTKHTPAPWEAKGSYVFAGNDCIGIFDTDNASETRMKANAKLSAAAPDMLEALKAVWRSPLFSHLSSAPQVSEAISKAEGCTDD